MAQISDDTIERENTETAITAIYRQVARDGCRSEMCHDCAFRNDSPEMEEFRDVGFGTKVMTLLEDLEYVFAGATDRPSIFVCHQGMPTGPKGPPDYQPPRDERGNPIGFPVCAGWAKRFNQALNDWQGDDTEPDFEEADDGKCPYCGKKLILDGTTLYCEEGCF